MHNCRENRLIFYWVARMELSVLSNGTVYLFCCRIYTSLKFDLSHYAWERCARLCSLRSIVDWLNVHIRDVCRNRWERFLMESTCDPRNQCSLMKPCPSSRWVVFGIKVAWFMLWQRVCICRFALVGANLTKRWSYFSLSCLCQAASDVQRHGRSVLLVLKSNLRSRSSFHSTPCTVCASHFKKREV